MVVLSADTIQMVVFSKAYQSTIQGVLSISFIRFGFGLLSCGYRPLRGAMDVRTVRDISVNMA